MQSNEKNYIIPYLSYIHIIPSLMLLLKYKVITSNFFLVLKKPSKSKKDNNQKKIRFIMTYRYGPVLGFLDSL